MKFKILLTLFVCLFSVTAMKAELEVPYNFGAIGTSTSEILVSWNPVSGASAYYIYRADSADGNYIMDGTSTTNSFKSTGLKPQTQYYYKVRAIDNQGGMGKLSDVASATTLPACLEAPVISVEAALSNSIKVTWNTVVGAQYYNVYRDGAYIDQVYVPTFTDIGRVPGVEYCYVVVAGGDCGKSVNSNTACITLSDGSNPEVPVIDAPDIKGEASIYYSEERNALFLKNYDKEYEIPEDGTFVLYSSSYVYLNIETEVEIPMAYIYVAGELMIRVTGEKEGEEDGGGNSEPEPIEATLNIINDNKDWDAAIRVGRLDIYGEEAGYYGKYSTLNIINKAQNRDYGLLITHSLTIDGKHTLSSFYSAKKCGIKAGAYIKILNGATIDIKSKYAGIYSNSHLLVERAANINITVDASGDSTGAGILLDGNDTGIYLLAGSNRLSDPDYRPNQEEMDDPYSGFNPQDYEIRLNVKSNVGDAVRIKGNGNIIAKGLYVEGIYYQNNYSTEFLAEGITGAVNLTGNGYVRVDGAFLTAIKQGVDDAISAVHAPRSLAIVNNGRIEEHYRNTNLSISDTPYNITQELPAIGNNMRDHQTYDWSSYPSDMIDVVSEGLVSELSDVGSIMATRSNIVNTEWTKVDSISVDDKSTHFVRLDGVTTDGATEANVYFITVFSWESIEKAKAILAENISTTEMLSKIRDMGASCYDEGKLPTPVAVRTAFEVPPVSSIPSMVPGFTGCSMGTIRYYASNYGSVAPGTMITVGARDIIIVYGFYRIV